MPKPIGFVALAALVAVTLWGYITIPADLVLPVRWGLDGQVTSTLPRNLALLQMPLATLLVWVVFGLIGRFGTAERRPSTAIVLRWGQPLLTLLFALAQWLIVLVGRGVALPFFHAA